ncbi:MAG: xanthine dehydrogenase accessory protein XdhC [Pseudomonadota bacterium]
MNALWVEITETRGSAPRDAGTAMKVTQADTEGTIGGGALEFAAIKKARDMLAEGERAATDKVPLGPGLGQCCGGSVTLRYTDRPCATDVAEELPVLPARQGPEVPLWIWGAGHVGRALVRVLAPERAFDITWIDRDRARFPAQITEGVTALPAQDMPRLAKRAPRAHHIIATYSHDIDFNLCVVLLRRGFVTCGLIGSETKWARFRKRLDALALYANDITCPIGDKALGKHPDAIAASTARALLLYEGPA